MGKYGEVWKYRVMIGKYGEVWNNRVQILEWVIMVAMSAQVYHDLPYHFDHDLADQLSPSIYLKWVAYKLEWMTPEV